MQVQWRIQPPGRGGTRNMKSMQPSLAAIFLWLILQGRRGMAPLAPRIRYWGIRNIFLISGAEFFKLSDCIMDDILENLTYKANDGMRITQSIPGVG